MRKILLVLCSLLCPSLMLAQHIDELRFGDTTSEAKHGLSPFTLGKTVSYTGLAGQKARRLLPYTENPYSGQYPGIYGAELGFVMQVDSIKQNYLTVKFSGSELNPNRIVLTVDGKEVGTRHGGDEDLFLRKLEEPLLPGAFFYRTAPLPLSLTRHKRTVVIRLRSLGHLNEYCNTPFTCYQWNVTEPTLGLFKAYTHTDPGFEFAEDDIQGNPTSYSTAPAYPATDLQIIKANIITKANNKINSLMNGSDYIKTQPNNNYHEIEAMAIAYHEASITTAYHNPALVLKIRKLVDNLVVNSNNGTQKAAASWGGAFGRPAYAVHLIYDQLTGLNDVVDLGGGGGLTRRQQWIDLFKESFNFGASTRRTLANQEMENSVSVYGAALGLSKLDPVQFGKYPSIALHHLLEASGVEQYTGRMIISAGQFPALGDPITSDKGPGFYFVTPAGTTKEPGYASTDCYGNQIDKLVEMYHMTKTDTAVKTFGAGSGDTRILTKAATHAKMQAFFTYAGIENGQRAILSESDLCVRIQHYGHPFYTGLLAAAETGDEAVAGYFDQMVADGRAALDSEAPVYGHFYRYPAAIDAVLAGHSNIKMPTSPGQPDFVAFDADNMVISIKRGEERLFVTFNSRASYMNNLVRIHHITEKYDRKVELRPLQTEFRPTGNTFTRTGNLYGYNYVAPDKAENAYAGLIMPYAASDIAGKYIEGKSFGDLGVVRYGKYLVAINATSSLSKTINFPAEIVGRSAYRIDDRSQVSIPSTAVIGPNSVQVYYVGGTSQQAGLIPDSRPPATNVIKAALSDSLSKYVSFLQNETNVKNVSIAEIQGKYNLFLFSPFVQQLTNASYLYADTLATQSEVNTGLTNVIKAYNDLIGKKFLYTTNTLESGIYFIKLPGKDSIYTKNNTNVPKFEKKSADKNLQRFNINKESNGRYKITYLGTPPAGFFNYINENGAFGKNAYDATWNTMNIFSNGTNYAIQRAQRAGNGFWLVSGNLITAQSGTTNNPVPTTFPIELKLDIFGELDQKIADAIKLRDTTQKTTSHELGKYPVAANQELTDSIVYVQSIYGSLTTGTETKQIATILDSAMIKYKRSIYFNKNELPNGIYTIRVPGKELYWTKNSTNSPTFESLSSNKDIQRWEIVKQTNGRYKITCLSPPASYQNYINENATFAINAYQNIWNTMNIYSDGKNYAIQRAERAGNGYWSIGGNKILSAGTVADAFPYTFPISLVPSLSEQTISFPKMTVKRVGDPAVMLNGVTSSGLPLTYAVADTSIAKVVNGMLYIRKAGSSLITASQSGNGYYSPAVSVFDSIVVLKKEQTLSFEPLPANVRLGDQDIVLSANVTSGLPVLFKSSDEQIAGLEGNILHLRKAGTVIITAYQPGNEEYLPAKDSLGVLTINTIGLTVRYQDGDRNPGNNQLKPYLDLKNNGSVPLDISEISLRYWLTAENYTGLNTWVDYAAIGSNKVKMKYVPLGIPRNGAYGFIEYSFDRSVSPIAPGASTGIIQSRAANTDWSFLNENDDHSFHQNSSSLTINDHISVYRNNVLVAGTEPVEVNPIQAITISYQNQNNNTSGNSLSGSIMINNTGNLPLEWKDVSARYWFTTEGNEPLNFWKDYVKMGAGNLSGEFIRLSSVRQLADCYLELSFLSSAGILYPSCNSGDIKYRINKANWSNFNELNDFSFKPKNRPSENDHFTLYYKGQLIYGIEPSGVQNYAVSSLRTGYPAAQEKKIENVEITRSEPVVHQALSPNGDGQNDHLKIEGIESYPDNRLIIYNTTGALVADISNYNNGDHSFDGRSKGKVQLPGTYFYNLEYRSEGRSVKRSGYFIIKN